MFHHSLLSFCFSLADTGGMHASVSPGLLIIYFGFESSLVDKLITFWNVRFEGWESWSRVSAPASCC